MDWTDQARHLVRHQAAPHHAFDSVDAITMVAAEGWGQDVPYGPPGWITMGCEDVTGAPPTVVHLVMEDIPGS